MLLIKNGYIKTMAGPDVESGSILLGDDGKIIAVGTGIACPEDARIIDAQGRLVTPGCVEAHCHIGLHNEIVGWEGRDFNEIVDPITPQIRAIDSINPQDEAFGHALRGGVTAACTGPSSANVIGGTFVAIKLAGSRVDDMIIKDPVAMKCAFGENPKRCYGQSLKKAPITRMGVAALLRETLFKARNYMNEKNAGRSPSFDMKMEAMLPVMEKKIPLKAHVHRADDILTAIRVAKEFDVDITLDHCTDGAQIAQELAKEGKPCLVGPAFGSKSKLELANKSFATAKALSDAGVPVCIVTDAPVTPLQYLPLTAGLSVRAGLDRETAWKAITIYPARAIGIDSRVGSLEVGKDADVVIWTNDPLTYIDSEAWLTVVDGKIVYSAQ